MKISRVFIACAVLLFLVMLVIEYVRPKPFDWDTTYAHRDYNPFGCAVMDSVFSASLPNGYSVSPLTFGQLVLDSISHTSILVPNSSVQFDELMEKLHQHTNIILVNTEIYTYEDGYYYGDATNLLKDSLGLIQTRRNFSGYYYKQNLDFFKDAYKNQQHDLLVWKAGTGNYTTDLSTRILSPFVSMNDYKFSFNGRLRGKPLILSYYTNEDGKLSCDTIAAQFNIGNSKLIVLGTPRLFTNISVLTYGQSPMLMRLLSQVSEYPVIRLDPTEKTEIAGKSESELRVLLANPPLRWATYLILLLIVLAMFFTARRRQRVIPVITPPVNHSLAMVNHIGSLYFRRRDNADLLRKKYNYFVEDIRRRIMIDLDDSSQLNENLQALQDATGIGREELKTDLNLIQSLLDTEQKITNQQLMTSIDFLNKVLNNL